jgi:hypothetical protein
MIIHVKIREFNGPGMLEEILEIPDTGDRFSDILNAVAALENRLTYDTDWLARYKPE